MARLAKDPFEQLVREHHASVYRAAHRLVRDAEAAADVAQEVFLRVLEGRTTIGSTDAPRGVLCWLAARLGSNHLRSQRRRRHHEDRAMKDPRNHPAAPEDPAASLSAADLRHAVHDLVAALPADLQVPLQMRCQDELSFTAIGTALRVPESTVHDRVQQALRRLRDGLAGRGFAVALGGLPDLVATAEPIALPGGLEQRLLALPAAPVAGTVLTTKVAVAVFAVAVVIAMGVAVREWQRRPVEVPVRVATADVRAPSPGHPGGTASDATTDSGLAERSALAASPPASEAGGQDAAPDGTFVGTVHDAAAWPVAGARVEVVAAGGLKAFELGATTTNAQGAFRLECDGSGIRPSRVRLRVVEAGHVLLETDEFAVPRAADSAPLALVLRPEQGTAMTRYELRVSVKGENGAPLAGVPVRVLAIEARPPFDFGDAEASATTGGDGVAVLSGRSLGQKHLFVDGRPGGHQSHSGDVALDRPGVRDALVTLPAGRALDVRVGGFGGARVEWANVWLEDAASGLQHPGAPGADGSFRCTGLGDGPYTLHVWPPYDMSPYRRAGVRADSVAIDVSLKPRTETRDVGDHMAELHGQLVDAVTGEVVPYEGFDVDVMPWRPGESTLSSDRLVFSNQAQQLEIGGKRKDFCEVGLAPGRHALVASVDGYATTVLEFELRPGEMRTGLRVPLHRGGTIRGRVLTVDGKPAAGAHVFLAGVGSLADEVVAEWLATADRPIAGRVGPDGTFCLENLPPAVALRVAARLGDGAAVVALPPAISGREVDGVEIRLGAR